MSSTWAPKANTAAPARDKDDPATNGALGHRLVGAGCFVERNDGVDASRQDPRRHPCEQSGEKRTVGMGEQNPDVDAALLGKPRGRLHAGCTPTKRRTSAMSRPTIPP